MAQFANQKTIITHRSNVIQGSAPYLAIAIEDVAEASRNLSGIGFKLYLYLASNKDGFHRDYSPKHFASIYGVSVDSARKAPQDLIDNGYLILGEDGLYGFYEKPQKKLAIAITAEKRWIPLCDGAPIAMTFNELSKEAPDMDIDELKAFWNAQEVVK